jgi:alkyl hydroperoxide reductase subunit D
MTNLDQLRERLPDYARDLRINLGVIASSTALTPVQAWLVAVASAVTARNAELVAAITADAAQHVGPEVIEAGRAAASIMGMTNVYYRFLHFTGDSYAQMPARLRMQVLAKPGVPHVDFELACLAASAITGCERCVTSHDKSVVDKGGSPEAVQEAVRIAAVIHAVAIALEATPGFAPSAPPT